MGPIAGIIIELLKVLIKLIIKPTSTAFVGEISNLLGGIALCVPASILYKNEHNKKGAIKGLIIGGITMVIVTGVLNYAFIIPSYVRLFGMPLDAIVDAGKAIFPIIKDKFTFVLLCTTPFNFIKALIVCLVSFFLYKRISNLIK